MSKKTCKSIILNCKDCGKEFAVTSEEQKIFKSMDYEFPKRCPQCRETRKSERLKSKKSKEDEEALSILLAKIPYKTTFVEKLNFNDPSRSLVVIGNGFDIMHGAKSSYLDFSKTIGKNSTLRYEMETYIDNVGDLWFNLEEALGRLNYSKFLNQSVLDMYLEIYGAYKPNAQAADFYAAVEDSILPTFDIPRELKRRFKKWLKTLSIDETKKPFSVFHGDYKVLSFNYTEFIENLYNAKPDNVCYIHGCRKNRGKGKNNEIILGHKSGTEDKQWEKVNLNPIKFKSAHKRYIFNSAIEIAIRESTWYDDSTTKKCDEIIKNHVKFFESLNRIKNVYVIGHSLSEVDYPYFEEIAKRCNAKWFIGYHSYSDMLRLCKIVERLNIKDVTIFRT